MGTVKSRRDEATDATRAALVESATALFAERGYAATSLEDVSGAARVTKGALYHHFPKGKQALFEAVFVEVDRQLAERTVAGIQDGAQGWRLVEQGLDAYLSACADPVVRRVMFAEGPSVLGYDRWRALDGCEARHLLDETLAALAEQGEIGTAPLPLLSRLVFATLGEAGMAVADAEDADAARAEALTLLLAMLRGLRPAQAEARRAT